jgi:hypothetical protein
MGRRSRQRATTPAPPRAEPGASRPAATAPVAAPPRRGRRDAPPAPWGSFPLIELCALVAIAIGVWGFLRGGRGGAVLLTAAALLGSVAGLEIAIREHLGGFRSHSLVLSGTLTVATITGLFFAGLDRATLLPVAAAAFALALLAFRTLFKRRSGGASFRIR